ncbi:MAG: FtsX-like permease family protein [Leptospirales bacterium]
MKTIIYSLSYNIYQFFKLALKNITRNRRRTIMTMSGISIGTLMLVLLSSYVNSMHLGLKNDAINNQYGHFQIAEKGYFDADENSPEHMMSKETLDQLKSFALEFKSVDFVNTRLHLVGIIGTQSNSAIFSAIAGDPTVEGLMSPTIVEGSPLSSSDPTGIVIGEAMAKKLKVGVGDPLIAFVSTSFGSQEAIWVTVRGIYDALMPEQEKVIIYMPIESAWMLILEERAHRLLVFLNDHEKLPETMAAMQSYIDKNRLNLEIRDWETLAVFLKQVVGMFRGMIVVVGFIVFLVIIFNIQNTMYMSIHERFREIGTLRAMGASRGEVIRNFVAEGFLTGLIGAGLGIMIALILMPWINSMDLSLPPGPGQDKPTPIVFTRTNIVLVQALTVNVVTALLASILPAVKGSKTRIIDALRYV